MPVIENLIGLNNIKLMYMKEKIREVTIIGVGLCITKQSPHRNLREATSC